MTKRCRSWFVMTMACLLGAPSILAAEAPAAKSSISARTEFGTVVGKVGLVPTYAYEFADRHAPSPGFKMPPDVPLGAAHATELAYLFDFDQTGQALTPEQQQLASRMIHYWARFAANGDPNGPDLPPWPRFLDIGSAPRVQSLAPGDGGIVQTDTFSGHHCDFWFDGE